VSSFARVFLVALLVLVALSAGSGWQRSGTG
jgi:hypothetical protein